MNQRSSQLRLLVFSLLLYLFQSTASGQDLGGTWDGYWLSSANNHRGRISSTFQQTSPNQLQANFRGSFAKIVPFRYRAKLQIVHQEPGKTVLAGSRRLPIAGEFRYYAEITDSCFQGSFSSRRNHGTWIMQRR